jgi:molybdopterin-guanine dinucleotide biosynthesis protein A
MRVAAVVLAGGRGERLGGVVKAAVTVGGVRLVDRVLARVATCDPIVVAHGPHDPADLRLPANVTGIADLATDYAGPLAGFAAAIAALPGDTRLLVCAAVDSPFLPDDYVERLLQGLGDAPAAIAAYGGQPYPTSSIWRVDRIRDLPSRVLAGEAPRSLKSLAAALAAVTIEWPAASGGDPFANVNTPEDLARAEARAAASATGF